MLKIGHRGAKGYVAENTLASFEHAIKLGCDGIELDVQYSKDEVPVVIHDVTVNRTTSAKGKVSDFTAAELSNIGISSLVEVLTLVDEKCFVNIEIKNPFATAEVVKIVSEFIKVRNWNPNLLPISSFDFEVLRKVKNLNPQLFLGVLTEDSIAKALIFALEIKAYAIHPEFKLLKNEIVLEIKKNKFKIFPFTVNHPEDLTFVKNFLVDGIISDFPDKI
jgi:glycerophosphoryl diester phosphodiesterase